MPIIAYLNFTDKSEEVIKFYEKALDGKDIMMTRLKELPSDPSYALSKEDKELLANGSIKVAGSVLMFSDLPSFMRDEYQEGNNVSLAIVLKDKELLKKYYANLAKDGQIIMPLDEAPWTELYGMVVDKFGIGWQLSYSDDDYYY